MKPWIRVRYYCTNVAGGCALARADRAFPAADHARLNGVCPTAEGGCGAALKPGAPLDLRPRWAALGAGGLLLAAALSWGLHAMLFAPPLTHVDFAMRASESADDAGSIGIEVVRSANLDQGVQVDYAAVDGSARAGEDYAAAPGQLRFAPGQRSKTLVVALLPDASFRKTRRSFSLVLVNVRGAPRHLVTIAPRAVARSDAMVAERSVLAASVVAKDIADAAVQKRELGQLLAAGGASAGEMDEYRRALGAVDGNLARARASYLHLLRELRTQQPSMVLGAMDRVAGDLQRRTFGQQAQAVRVMKRQFTELLNDATPDMDRWVDELSRIVPRDSGAVRQAAATT